jgi:hypothetical protein
VSENVKIIEDTQISDPPVVDGVENQTPVAIRASVDEYVEERPLSTASGVTVESLLYLLLFGVAMGLRFGAIGLQPLSPLEAAQALPAWLDAMGRNVGVAATAHSPLLYSVQNILFWLTDGGGEGWARLFPALMGSLLVLSAWTLRPWLGRGGALLLALLLAVDPWLLTFSRLSDGAILSVTLGLLLWSGLLNGSTLSLRQMRWLAVALGLFVLSGPLTWLLIPPLLGTLFLYRPAFNLPPGESRRLLSIVGATILLAGTGALTQWEGLSIISTSFGVALSYLVGETVYPLQWPFLRLLVDQLFLVIFGLGGLALAWVAAPAEQVDRRWRLLLSGWLVYGLVLWLLPGRNPATLLIGALPLLLLAASTVVHVWRFATDETDWHDGLLIAITLGVLMVTTAFMTANALQPAAGVFDGRVMIFYLVLPALILFFVWWSGWRTTFQITALLLLLTLFLSVLSSGWMLNLRGELVRGHTLHAETSRPALRLLTADLEHLSAIRAGDPTVATVFVQAGPELRPLLGWHLRSLKNLSFVGAVDPTGIDEQTFVISQPGELLALPADFIGSHYAVSSLWLPTELDSAFARLRWWLFREVRSLPAEQNVVLWARQ